MRIAAGLARTLRCAVDPSWLTPLVSQLHSWTDTRLWQIQLLRQTCARTLPSGKM